MTFEVLFQIEDFTLEQIHNIAEGGREHLTKMIIKDSLTGKEYDCSNVEDMQLIANLLNQS